MQNFCHQKLSGGIKTQPNISQLKSLEIRRSTFLNYRSTDFEALKLGKCSVKSEEGEKRKEDV